MTLFEKTSSHWVRYDKYEWLLKEFSNWAFTFVSAFLYYQDKDTLDDMQKSLYRQGMATLRQPTILNCWKSQQLYDFMMN